MNEKCNYFSRSASESAWRGKYELCRGIDGELVRRLGEWAPRPTTYAGGARALADLAEVERLGQGRIDLTIGSALDIFGGTGVKYVEAVEFNRGRGGNPNTRRHRS